MIMEGFLVSFSRSAHLSAKTRASWPASKARWPGC